MRHRKAITFTFSGLNLGGGISGRYWLTDEYCIRVGIRGVYESSDDNSALVDSNDTRNSHTWTEMNLYAGAARYFPLNKNLSPYVGLSGGYTYSVQTNDYISLYTTERYRSKYNYYSAGVFVGVEYWIADNISLSGEQGIAVQYYTAYNTTTWRISHSNSSLLLSLYF